MPFIEPKLEIAKGNYTNHSHIYQIGFNSNVAGDFETLWTLGGTYPTDQIATANALHISSSANEDTVEGVGARTITIEGLDANYNVVTETLSMQGKIAVSSSNSFIAINKAFIATGGAAEQSGSIRINASGSATNIVVGIIDSNHKQLTQAHYTIPAGHKAYLQNVNCGVGNNISSSFALYQKPSGSVYRSVTFDTTFGDPTSTNVNSAIEFDEKTELDLRAKGDVSNGLASGQFSLILVSSSNIPVEPARIEGFIL